MTTHLECYSEILHRLQEISKTMQIITKQSKDKLLTT